MQGILRLVWDTVRGPRIFGPALFVFLWQACPSPTTAMFFFQTEVLCFSPAFQEVVWLSGSLAAFSGVLLYQRYLVDKPIKVRTGAHPWLCAPGTKTGPLGTDVG